MWRDFYNVEGVNNVDGCSIVKQRLHIKNDEKIQLSITDKRTQSVRCSCN